MKSNCISTLDLPILLPGVRSEQAMVTWRSHCQLLMMFSSQLYVRLPCQSHIALPLVHGLRDPVFAYTSISRQGCTNRLYPRIGLSGLSYMI